MVFSASKVPPGQIRAASRVMDPRVVRIESQRPLGKLERDNPVLILFALHSYVQPRRTVQVVEGQSRISTSERRIDLTCLLEQQASLVLGFGREHIRKTVTLQEQIISPHVLWFPPPCRGLPIIKNALHDP